MSLDPDRLRHAMSLAGVAATEEEAEALADLLAVREEVLPHLMLKRGAFQGNPRIRESLAAASRTIPVGQDRPPGWPDSVRSAAADVELTRRLEAVIALESREGETLAAAERALRDRVLSSPPAAYDAHLRIRLPDQG